MHNANVGVGCGSVQASCGGSGDCPSPPDICLKRHDTNPPFRVSMSGCDGPVDLTDGDYVIEASMWFDAKLKASVESSTASIAFADGVGFDSVAVGDVVVTSKSRNPEKMLVTGVDESARTVQVSRGHAGTAAQGWDKGTPLKVFRFADQPANAESVMDTIEEMDGSSSEVLSDTVLSYVWAPGQTSMPGCYWLEFKILKMADESSVEWVQRIPLSSDGFMIRIVDSPTSPA